MQARVENKDPPNVSYYIIFSFSSEALSLNKNPMTMYVQNPQFI